MTQPLSRKDLVTILDWTRQDIETVFATTREQKPLARAHKLPASHPGRTLACIFHKPSLRTRVSFEVAMTQLGGCLRDVGGAPATAPDDASRRVARLLDRPGQVDHHVFHQISERCQHARTVGGRSTRHTFPTTPPRGGVSGSGRPPARPPGAVVSPLCAVSCEGS